jgi:DNA-binding PadR family transcriptional regulator
MRDDTGELLQVWERNYKKGLLSFWLMLVVHERPAYALELGSLVERASGGSLTADDNSIYRALARFERVGLIAGESRPSTLGPDRRYFRLTAKGRRLLRRFAERNILVLQRDDVRRRLRPLFIASRAEEE